MFKKAKKDTYKLSIIGNAGVGKSSILDRVINSRFISNDNSTIGAAFATYKHSDIRYQMWDTAGQERYQALLPMYLRNSRIVFVVYDVNNVVTLEKIENHWIDFILENSEDSHLILIGNKTDINYASKDSIIDRAKRFAKNKNIVHRTVSAKTGTGIMELFDECNRHVAQYKKLNRVSDTHVSDTGMSDTINIIPRKLENSSSDSSCMGTTCNMI